MLRHNYRNQESTDCGHIPTLRPPCMRSARLKQEPTPTTPLTFVHQFGDNDPKALAKLIKHRDVLLTFYELPAAHRAHLRTTNPIDSAFATVRARTKVTKGAEARRRGLVMVYKLLDTAQDRVEESQQPRARRPRASRHRIQRRKPSRKEN